MLGHIVQDGYDIRPRNSGKRLFSDNRFKVKPDDAFNEPCPANTLAGPSEMRRIVVECEIDGVAAPLLIIVYRVDTLRN